MKKRLLIPLLCAMMAFMMAACADKTVKTAETEDITDTESIAETENITDTESKADTESVADTEDIPGTEIITDTENTEDTENIADIELSEEAKAMIPLFNAMNNFFIEISNLQNWSEVASVEYDPEDNMQYWSCLARVGAMCGDLYGDPLFTYEDNYYKIGADLMRDFAYACFADRNQLDTVPIPDSVDSTVYYDYDWDAYFVQAGDAGAVKTIITSFTDNNDGTYVAEVDYVDPSENDKVLQHFTYELVDNEIADMSVFPYAVKNMIKVENDN